MTAWELFKEFRAGKSLILIAREQGGDLPWAESMLRQYIEKLMHDPPEPTDIRQRPSHVQAGWTSSVATHFVSEWKQFGEMNK